MARARVIEAPDSLTEPWWATRPIPAPLRLIEVLDRPGMFIVSIFDPIRHELCWKKIDA